MPHSLDAPLAAEIAKPQLQPFIGLHIDLPDPVRAVTGNVTLQFAGAEWAAIGGIGTIDVITESTDGSANGVSATLLQVPSEFRDDVADQATRGCLYELYVGAVDVTFRTVIGIKRIWRGTLQGYDITDAGDTLSVKASGESRAIDQRRPAVKRFTDWWQQRKYPGDRFFEYVPAMAEISILWARAAQDATTVGGGAGGGGYAANVNLV